MIQPLSGSAFQTETLIVVIQGRVQGVGFRAAAVRKAHALGVCGWVRNQPDGSVQALVQGSPESVDLLLSWFNMGPPNARVSHIDYQSVSTNRKFDRFEVN